MAVKTWGLLNICVVASKHKNDVFPGLSKIPFRNERANINNTHMEDIVELLPGILKGYAIEAPGAWE